MNKWLIKISFLICLLVVVYNPWFFSSGSLTGGDWPYVWDEMADTFSYLPQLTRDYVGFGGTTIPFTSVEWYYQATAKLGSGLPWEVTERLFWFFPILIIGVLTSYRLTKSIIGSLIYMTNTYILMILDGGQLGVAFAYSLLPFMIEQGMQLPRRPVLFAIALSSVLFFDIRVAYMGLIVVSLFILLNAQHFMKREVLFQLVKSLAMVATVTILLHFYWLPQVLFNSSHFIGQFSGEITSIDAVKFFSFTKFEQSFSLFHANWPENIFGMTGFMRPGFLLIPIVAYSSLLFLSKTKSTLQQVNSRTILFFSILGIVGAFLAKGAQEPFGGIYLWLFEHIPGFVMFRDPSKFLMLVGLAYSILIPYSLSGLSTWVMSKFKFQILLPIMFLVYWFILIYPAWGGQLHGTFKPKQVPEDYVVLTNYLANKDEYFRIFWIPGRQRFGYYSNKHPALDSMYVVSAKSPAEVVDWIENSESARWQLDEWQVRYIVVPYDSEKELFVYDRTYDDQLRQSVINRLDAVDWLERVAIEGRTVLYAVL